MSNLIRVSLLLAASLFLLACAQDAQGRTVPLSYGGVDYALERVAGGLNSPIDIVNAGDGSGRLFVIEQEGFIRILEDGELLETPFIEITDRTRSGGERGLLGLAFHPNYAENGLFYVNFTDQQGDTVVAQYSVSDDSNVADVGSEEVLLTIEQPEGNHNGGDLAFGPDGYLYIATGDGGGGGDRHGEIGNGQDLTTLLGKLLRIDVDNGDPYAVPEDNPFVDDASAADEIWAYGLRNPWRFSFDRATGDLYMGDVGQGAFEEVNVQVSSSSGGENYGWRVMEGFNCFQPSSGCDTSGLVEPVVEYPHSVGNSITGGYVYRGEALPELVGTYLYGDFGSGRIWVTRQDGGWADELFVDTDFNISSFGEDEAGELYVLDYSGAVYRLSAQ